MEQHRKESAFNKLQCELFDVTGLVFDVRSDSSGVHLILEDVVVLTLPHSSMDHPSKFIRSRDFPKNLKVGPTLAQRYHIVKEASQMQPFRDNLRDILGETSINNSLTLDRIEDLEEKARERFRQMMWELDDVTIARIAKII